MISLTEKVVRLHAALTDAGLPHAFGGALALAFCTAEPRATRDVDVNVFVGVDRVEEVVRALPPPVRVTAENRRQLERDAQARAMWADTPVDLFLSDHPFHDRAAANVRTVPFAGVASLPVLACSDLAVFKAFLARPKDAVDVAAMVDVGAIDLRRLRTTVEGLLGSEDRTTFFARVESFVAET